MYYFCGMAKKGKKKQVTVSMSGYVTKSARIPFEIQDKLTKIGENMRPTCNFTQVLIAACEDYIDNNSHLIES